jgi:protein-tyrosine phosphatase
VPITDEEAPALDDLERALAWVGDCINAGKKVLVHCRFGIGRTGTFVAAYLMSKGHSIKVALRTMKHTPSLPMGINH